MLEVYVYGDVDGREWNGDGIDGDDRVSRNGNADQAYVG
jgi:hypothetical protein